MKRAVLLLLSTLLTLLLTSAVVAERNTCDVNYANKLGQAGGALDAFYGSKATALFTAERSVPLRFPAALWYFSKGDSASTTSANKLLALEFTYNSDPSSLGRFSLAWIAHSYHDELTSENQANITKFFSSFTPPAAPEVEHFLGLAAQSLFSDTPSARQQLITLLKQKGNDGWASELNQHALALVVQGLNGLLAASDNATIQTLAEMNLDIIMARFAALDVGGQFALVGGGDSLANNAFEPRQRPWYGWHQLFFTGGVDTFVEPSVLLSGYCPNEAVRAVFDSRQSHDLVMRDDLGGKERYAYSTSDYVLSSTEDRSTPFTDEYGFLTRAGAWFSDGSFLTLSTRVSNDSSSASSDAEADDGGRLFAANNVVLGRLGDPSKPCQEPHAYVSTFDDFYNAADLPTPGDSVVVEMNGHLLLLTFLGGSLMADVTERYRPMAGHIPTVYGTLGDQHQDPDMGGRGVVIFPQDGTTGGLFALEAVPQTVIDTLNQRIADPDDPISGFDLTAALATYATTETSLTENSGTLTYQALDSRTYKYNPSTGTGTPSPGQFSLRNALCSSDENYKFISTDGEEWTIKGELNGQGTHLTLNFNEVAREGNLGGESGSGGGVDELPASTLAFLAGSLLKGHDEYLLDCGDPAEVLPNPPQDGTVLKVCVMRSGADKTVGLFYDASQEAPVATILQTLSTYYPFSTDQAGVDATMCDDKLNNYADATGLSFDKCGSIPLATGGSLSVWVNPARNLLVFSTDSNPFTSGFLDGLTDFLAGLFGATAEGSTIGQAVDAAYFLKQEGVNISAVRNGDAATLTYTGLGASVQPLLQNFGSRASFRAGGDEQRVLLNNINPTEFRLLTAALRPDTSAAPMIFKRFCGNGVVESPNDDGVYEECDDGNTVNDDGCNNSCELVGPPAGACQDLDHDGYNGSTESCTQGTDCYDEDPSSVVYNYTTNEKCDGIDATACGVLPTSRCPQCSHPGAPEVCGDGKDNDCSQGADTDCIGDSGGGTSGEDYGCLEPTGCLSVCEIQFVPTDDRERCPTEWVVNAIRGHYTFSTRINEEGVAELKIDADGDSEERVSCVLCPVNKCNEGSDAEMEETITTLHFTLPEPGSQQAIFHNGGGDTADVYLRFDNNEWLVKYQDSGSQDSKSCWGVGGSTTFTIPAPPKTCTANDCPTEWQDVGDQGNYHFQMRWGDDGYPHLKVSVKDSTLTYNGVDCGRLLRGDSWVQEVEFPWWVSPSGQNGAGTILFGDSGGAHSAVITLYAYRDPQAGSEFRLLYLPVGTEGGSQNVAQCWGIANDENFDVDKLYNPFWSVNIFEKGVCHTQVCQSDDDCAPHRACAPVGQNTNLCLIDRLPAGQCFTPDTPVLLANGTEQPISTLREGMQVLGFDEATGTPQPTTISTILRHSTSRDLVVVNGVLKVTPEHLFRTVRGWTPASSLRPGDLLSTPDGVEVVTSIAHQPYQGVVYNLHNQPLHNYYARGVLVHNLKVDDVVSCFERPELCRIDFVPQAGEI